MPLMQPSTSWKKKKKKKKIKGMATHQALWGIGIEAAFYGHYLGFYMIMTAILVTFLESVFAINLCVLVCVGNDDSTSCCQRFWNIILWIDNWKKGIFYMTLSIPCFIQPNEVWMGIIAGVMLIISGILYCLKTCRNEDETLEKLSENATYDRFDDIQEEIEDNMYNPTDQPRDMGLADQSEILEV
ncbi:hypothetical protein FSP39_016325 [Pinctada imbricata]|uniref:Uncharacterized protein n=1 Tax=Pinctada imbricata TaxID=66713 RepID=A0AA88XSF5_PINIB|nr:hypothetical protein FSP39_016325 [Pinctada imbricata]